MSAGIGVAGESATGAPQQSSSQIGSVPVQTPIDATMARLARLERVAGFNPAHLSAGARNLFSLVERWTGIRDRLVKDAARPAYFDELSGAPSIARNPLGAGTDLRISRYSGFTQSEPATAWCGANAVMGFNDSGAEVSTMASGRGVSMDSYALSSNHGRTFAYMGSPATPSDPNTFMASDPVVACAETATFYYVSAHVDSTNGISGVKPVKLDRRRPNVCAARSDSESTLGQSYRGRSLGRGRTRKAVTSLCELHDLDFSGSICGTESGSAIPRYAIEIVSSADGGATWTLVPVTIAQVCAHNSYPFAFVGGSRVAVGPAGDVYVVWELFDDLDALGGREIQVARSTDQAQSFPASPVTVTTINCASDCADWQGLIHSNEYPSLAIGKGPNSGRIYLAWNSGNRQVPDALTTTGSYNFTDIMFSQSQDAGASRSLPVRVNRDPEGGSSLHVDHFEPALASDSTGCIAICFFDRRNDPANFPIDRYCASSADGKKWTDNRISLTHFPVVVGQDILMTPDYMGDYDTLASDALD